MDYTVFALDVNDEVLGEHLLVSSENLASAIGSLVAFWEMQQEGVIDDEATVGVHCEVYEGAVRDRHGWKPLSWEPGRPVIDLNKLVSFNGSERQACALPNGQNVADDDEARAESGVAYEEEERARR
jgi:hypothetical protein